MTKRFLEDFAPGQKYQSQPYHLDELNRNGEPVQVFVGNLIVPKRPT